MTRFPSLLLLLLLLPCRLIHRPHTLATYTVQDIKTLTLVILILVKTSLPFPNLKHHLPQLTLVCTSISLMFFLPLPLSYSLPSLPYFTFASLLIYFILSTAEVTAASASFTTSGSSTFLFPRKDKKMLYPIWMELM